MEEIIYYTDGAYSSKSEMGGWGAIRVKDNSVIEEMSGYEPFTTGNRMELYACLNVLNKIEDIKNEFKNMPIKIIINTDSRYISDCINEGWYRNWLSNGWKRADKQEVKNQDLWVKIITLYIKNQNIIQFVKVKAHQKNGDKWNDYVDKLAVKRRKELEK